MANQDRHGSNLPFEVDQTTGQFMKRPFHNHQCLGHPINLCPSNSEPDLSLHLSLGRGGKYYPILPIQNPQPSSSSFLSGIRGGATSVAEAPKIYTLNGGEENAHLIKHLQATKRFEVERKMSWKKRAREANNHVVSREVTVAVPPPVLSVQANANVDSVENNKAFRRAIAIIKSTLNRRPGTSDAMETGNVVTHAGTQMEPVKLNPVKMDAAQPMIAYNSDDKGKSMMMYNQLDHEAESPLKMAKRDDFHMSKDEMEQMMKLMPRVTTSGGLPSRRKIEGVLFKYLEGKVLIVCVCHGHFLSPEEFVQHAGGSDLSNSMRHIKVQP